MSLKGNAAEQLEISDLRLADLQRLALATLRQTTPGVVGSKQIKLRGRTVPAGTRLRSITLRSAAQHVERFNLWTSEDVKAQLARGPFPVTFEVWQTLDSQALERSWKVLNRCRGSLKHMQPNVFFFFLHALADGHNRIQIGAKL
jgi:hypothetical protein